MFIQPYLFFDGQCEEALEFYKKALGAEVESLMRFSESPDPQTVQGMPPGSENKIMHSNFRIRDTQIMASDGHCANAAKFEGIGLTLNAIDAEDASKLFTALSEGGQVLMPLAETFFAHSFGMVGDKFGVTWLIIAAKRPQ